ncbi:hypothetical protein GCM10027610_009510 [Dactylosporangium cerinum]
MAHGLRGEGVQGLALAGADVAGAVVDDAQRAEGVAVLVDEGEPA